MEKKDIADLLRGKKIVIYGVGRIGKGIFTSLKSSGYKVEFFWDRNADAIEKIDDVPILRPDPGLVPIEERKGYIVLVTISAKNVSKEIADILSKFGYDAIHDRLAINSIIYQACKTEISEHRFSFSLLACHTCPVPKENYNNSSCDIFNGYIISNLVKGVSHE